MSIASSPPDSWPADSLSGPAPEGIVRRGTALVTGGAVRLGKALAMSLAQRGFHIALHFNSSCEAALETREAIRATGVECDLFPFDLHAEVEMAPLLAAVRERFSDLAVLVNSASAYDAAPILQTDRGLFERQFKINFQAPFFLTQAFARSVETGCVVNILDNKIFFHQYHYAAYLLSKKTLAEFTQLAALELAPRIRVNGICPGVILPAESRTADYVNWRVRGIPLHRQGGTQNICHALHYLLENDFVTGQILTVDGGESLTNIGQNAAAYEQEKANP